MGYNFGTKIINYWFVKNNQGFLLNFFLNFSLSLSLFFTLWEQFCLWFVILLFWWHTFIFEYFFSFLFFFSFDSDLRTFCCIFLYFFMNFLLILLICRLELTFTWWSLFNVYILKENFCIRLKERCNGYFMIFIFGMRKMAIYHFGSWLLQFSKRLTFATDFNDF